MKIQAIIDLFPLKAQVTQEIIDNAEIYNVNNCIGALTLKSVIPEEFHDHLNWGNNEGSLYTNKNEKTSDGRQVYIGTDLDVRFMSVKEPIDVKFRVVGVKRKRG